MSGKNQYNVLVDMDDGAYTQVSREARVPRALAMALTWNAWHVANTINPRIAGHIESDGLEFQDFSNTSNSTSAPPPPPPSGRTGSFFDTQPQQRSSGPGKAIWSLDYYAQYFDVDTSQVIERCLKTVYPVGDFASDTLNNQPDLYGPFWIPTTVIFALFVCSSLAGSLAAYIAGVPYHSDFRYLSIALAVVYTYAFLCPALVWAATKYYGCQPSLLEIINYYGYGLTVWVPVSALCIMPFDIARWIFVGVAFALTAYFLVKNMYTVISRADAKTSRILLLVILAAHAGFALILKFKFYSYSFPTAEQPAQDQ